MVEKQSGGSEQKGKECFCGFVSKSYCLLLFSALSQLSNLADHTFHGNVFLHNTSDSVGSSQAKDERCWTLEAKRF